MPIQLASKNVVFSEDTDVVVASRYVKVGTTWAKSTIYSGPCDLQEGVGTLGYNAAGVVIQADAKCFICPIPTPTIANDDELVFNGNVDQTYVAVSIGTWSMYPQHIEISLKAGALQYRGKT